MLKITIDLTPGEIVACIHALKSMTRFNNTEQRDRNESALSVLESAYRHVTADISYQESRRSAEVYTK